MWRVQNSGDECWPLGCYLQFTAGDQLSTVQRIAAPPLSPSATTDLTVQMTSPSTPGIFQSKWRMITPSGSYFGGKFHYTPISVLCVFELILKFINI